LTILSAAISSKAIERGEITSRRRKFTGDRAGPIGVIPQVRSRCLGLKLRQGLAKIGDPKVDARLVYAATQVAQRVGVVDHVSDLRRGRT
jgi:hypothetical protein